MFFFLVFNDPRFSLACFAFFSLFPGQDEKGGGGSGTVLDMHTQQGNKGHKGLRFEDPHWWAHLPALKPIGLTCLLAERTSEVRGLKDAHVAVGIALRSRSPFFRPIPPPACDAGAHSGRDVCDGVWSLALFLCSEAAGLCFK